MRDRNDVLHVWGDYFKTSPSQGENTVIDLPSTAEGEEKMEETVDAEMRSAIKKRKMVVIEQVFVLLSYAVC